MRFLPLALVALSLSCRSSQPSRDPTRTVEAFRSACSEGDFASARQLQSSDPRVWYERREGPGEPWTLGGGTWDAWDRHFRSSSTPGPWRIEGSAVVADVTEINDDYRLAERGAQRHRLTYFLDDEGKLSGLMVSGLPSPDGRGRRDEFLAWARANEPMELDYLMPGARIDPTGDRAPRARALLERWRRSAGLPMFE
jgi:hypothetical protein